MDSVMGFPFAEGCLILPKIIEVSWLNTQYRRDIGLFVTAPNKNDNEYRPILAYKVEKVGWFVFDEYLEEKETVIQEDLIWEMETYKKALIALENHFQIADDLLSELQKVYDDMIQYHKTVVEV